MTKKNETLTIPESVKSYLKEKSVRTAVDHLVNIKPSKFPPELDWEEVPNYFEARKAAEIVRYDMASLLHQLWAEIWGHWLDGSPQWIAGSLDDHQENDSGYTDADECFTEALIYRYHDYSANTKLSVWTAVKISQGPQGQNLGKMEIGFCITGGKVAGKRELAAEDGYVWVNDNHWEEWMVCKDLPSIFKPNCVSICRAKAKEGLDAASAYMVNISRKNRTP